MSILITGGAGYIGSHCNKVLKKAGYDTVILDDLSNGHKEAIGDSELIIGDIGDRDILNSIFSDHKIDGVIHLAAKKSVEESVSDPDLYYRENVVKTGILLDVMRENNVGNFVFSSSAAVYGDASGTQGSSDSAVVDENFPTDPINPYGETKLAVEKMLIDHNEKYGLYFCALRYFNVAGADPDGKIGSAGLEEKNIMPLLMDAVTTKGYELTVFGDDYNTRDGSCIRDYIHVMDLAEVHLLAYEYLIRNSSPDDLDNEPAGSGSAIINLGSNSGFSVLELIHETEVVTGKIINYKIGPRRAGDPAILVASNKKAKDLLGWTPKYSSIKDIIRDSYNWKLNKRY